ncbi:MAG: hypothetical protein A2945_04180 [Candidatus Liptonbacteria bacterium RIFCSPLOWO2_01_FULL_52_25]|uniref:Uncharacterized protein n=1 Tax=Candidatus Liptonbacteria bacterium RIFCSPLOWO2_01_FULL_52_25 TaxID=1798650 RepID=A0A1G2CC98_9BACT|nr:MAG: hypothetical protein A2945_04180 [Candidatus Liptonbacteria bacterium RIFCSPLOWO2_01_FULL_52_25]
MDLIKILKQFKQIEPSPDFAKRSRGIILNSRHSLRASMWSLFIRNLEFGASMALAGFLIVMMVGGFSAWNTFSPFPISNLDPAGLKAEAEAIDIQIQLTYLNYAGEGALSIIQSESTPQTIIPSPGGGLEDAGETNDVRVVQENTSTPSTVSIDDALFELSQ